MDRLELFFTHLALSARVFLAGRLCGTSSDHATETGAHLHVVRNGKMRILHANGGADMVEEPTILLYPYPERHTFQSDGADIVCAFVEFAVGSVNPLGIMLPNLMQFPLAVVPELSPVVDLLFDEGFGDKPGRQIAIDRLAEYIFVVLLRAGVHQRVLWEGMLPAFSDPRLSKAIDAIHFQPEKRWKLVELARIAGMSRARFAELFHEVTGHTPFEYLSLWRITVAQSLLKKGDSLKLVAPHVGYATAEALARAFTHHIGMSPAAWLAGQQRPTPRD